MNTEKKIIKLFKTITNEYGKSQLINELNSIDEVLLYDS